MKSRIIFSFDNSKFGRKKFPNPLIKIANGATGYPGLRGTKESFMEMDRPLSDSVLLQEAIMKAVLDKTGLHMYVYLLVENDSIDLHLGWWTKII